MKLLALALAPGLLLLMFVYLKDKYEREPMRLLLKAFAYGAISAVILLTFWVSIELLHIPLPVSSNLYVQVFYEAFLQAAVPEETVKFVFFLVFIYKMNDFNEWFDGIVYASAISLGFATVENIIYVFSQGTSVGIMRAIFAVPAHFITGVTQGFFFSLAKFGGKKLTNIALALITAIIIHGIYDYFLMLDKWQVFVPFLIYFAGIVWLAKKLIARHIDKSQFKPGQS